MGESIVMKDRFDGLCSNCEEKTRLDVIIEEEVIDVRKEPIKVEIQYCRCTQCGDEVFDSNFNQDPVELAYKVYRTNHGLLQPEEIRIWRKAYRLTQGELAKLLGLGTATISRYENGSLQEESHDRLLRLAMEPANLIKMINDSKGIFTDKDKREFIDEFKDMKVNKQAADNTIILHLGSYEPNEFNGYMSMDINKFYNAILYFCTDGTFETKLNKLMFYADFKHYKEYSIPITGAQYAHLPYGPVPDDYTMYYGALKSYKAIEFVEKYIGETDVGTIIRATKEPDLSIFSPSELRIMAGVKEYFAQYNAKAIMKYSHKEVGYKETQDGESISYRFAEQLSY